MPKPLSREERAARQARKQKIQQLLDIVEGTDQKIGDLDKEIKTFIEENAEAIGRDPHLDFEQRLFNGWIDEILIEMWTVLSCVLPLLPEVAVGCTSIPTIWRRDFQHPRVACRPEQKSATPLIDALEPHARQNPALLNPLRNLITVTGDDDRQLALMPPEVTTIINRYRAKPEPKHFTVGFVPNPNTKIQLAMVEAGDVIMSAPNSVGPFLDELLEKLRTFVEINLQPT